MQIDLRTSFLKARVALILEYLELSEADRRLDMLADGHSYEPTTKVWTQYPDIDIFALDLLRKVQRLRSMAAAMKKSDRDEIKNQWTIDAWKRFILEYTVNHKRWWLSSKYATDPHDDILMQDADRSEREFKQMIKEDEYARRLRAEERRLLELNLARERKMMAEEDLLSRNIRDQTLRFAFMHTM